MYELVHVATKRTRQLYKGADPLVKSKNRLIVTALREIAAGKVMTKTAASADESSPLDELSRLSN
jgi:DNA-directed RNA polymerase subunit omega